ncbi:MAG: PEP-CTERM sorting domain-containing protein [Methylococcales bacterium]
MRPGDVAVVPVPPAVWLLGSGLLGLLGLRRRGNTAPAIYA